MYSGFKLKHSDKMHNTNFGYIDLMSNNLNFINYEITNEDIDSLTYWCDIISEKKLFVPRRGLTSYCKKCPFDDPCMKWVGWK